MLSLRLVIFAAVSGIALWGLFALLDTLREPELLRSAKAIVVKGCEPIESEHARQLCPQLFCQKFLLEKRGLPLRSIFKVTVDKRAGREQLIGGALQTGGADSGQRFACVLHDDKVAGGGIVDDHRLNILSLLAESWPVPE
ncbi:MAG TPA: hypothetical protein VJT80_25755 [Steroidobacteraceae bacterium]|nr:hypothetical protein [Steroidobacteraceae bacterium]